MTICGRCGKTYHRDEGPMICVCQACLDNPPPPSEPTVTDVGPRSYMGSMVDGLPALVCYDEPKDETMVVDRDHPFYAEAMAAFSIIEMAFAPVLQEKPKKRTIIHAERPRLIRGLH